MSCYDYCGGEHGGSLSYGLSGVTGTRRECTVSPGDEERWGLVTGGPVFVTGVRGRHANIYSHGSGSSAEAAPPTLSTALPTSKGVHEVAAGESNGSLLDPRRGWWGCVGRVFLLASTALRADVHWACLDADWFVGCISVTRQWSVEFHGLH